MQVGIIGLGRMGGGMAQRLMVAGHKVVGYNRTIERAEAMAEAGLIVAKSPAELVQKLESPRVIYVMVPLARRTESLKRLLPPSIIMSPLDTYLAIPSWPKIISSVASPAGTIT